ncbi:unannotated protein [freshwater metagenome]|uniref:Unannotated protein n=1 Tax=freshwater metagenome TaxID=449393 RepID=A0A6J6EID8_9ZZZZ
MFIAPASPCAADDRPRGAADATSDWVAGTPSACTAPSTAKSSAITIGTVSTP